MTSFRIVLRNSSYLIGFKLLSRLLSVVFLIYAASRLVPESFGALSFTLVTLELINTIGDLGITRYGARELVRCRDEGEKLAGKILSVQVVTSMMLTLAGLLIVLAWNPPQEKLELMLLALSSFFFYSFINTTESIFIANQKFFFSALFTFVGRLVYMVIGLAVLFTTGSIVLIMWGFLLAVIVETLLRLGLVRIRITRFSLRFPFHEMWTMLRRCVPFAVAGIGSVISYRGNVFVLDFLEGDAPVGVFNVAFSLLSSLIWVGLVFSATIFPGLAADFMNNQDAFRASCWHWYRLVALLSIPVAMTFMLLSGTIRDFFPAGYEDVKPMLIILMWLVPLTLIMDIDFNILQVSNRETIAARSVVIAAISSPLFGFLFIPFMGASGAAVALLMATVVREAYCRFQVRDSISNRSVAGLLARPLIAGAAMGAVALLTFSFNPWAAVALGLVVYAILVLAMGVVRPSEIKSLFLKPAAAGVNSAGEKYRKVP